MEEGISTDGLDQSAEAPSAVTLEADSPPPVVPFPIVGIGASAGGLKAFRELLEHLPADTGMAFVLIPHLDPARESLISELLSRSNSMPVREVRGETPLEANHVYVIQPNTTLAFSQGRLAPVPKEGTSHRHDAIDLFLTSLAGTSRDRAIGIVLSGTASDGAAGIRAIRAEGGITFAQDDSAEFSDMPQNAIETGCVDFILSPQKIAEELSWISRHPYLKRSPQSTEADLDSSNDSDPGCIVRIQRLLRFTTGVDFAQYKQSTFRRRIARRMALCKMTTLQAYLAHLQTHPNEVRILHDEILIHVTSFFRDPEAFQALCDTAFPPLLTRSPKDTIRVWVPGCSSGEEAYTVAIQLLEFLDEKKITLPIQIFATDVSERAIERARAGVYGAPIRSDVTPERLQRFFVPAKGGKYQIAKSVRDLCIFARQDVTRDPPFSNLDLITCRNMLIYLDTALQHRVIPLFHYALRTGGFLMLGSSEALDADTPYFKTIDKKRRIYSKVPLARAPSPGLPSTRDLPDAQKHIARRAADVSKHQLDVKTEAERVLLSQYAPNGIIVDDEGEILQIRGDVNRFLKLPPGKPNHNIFKMARRDIVVELELALREARRKGAPVRRKHVTLQSEEGTLEISVRVFPITAPGRTERHYAVLFEESPSSIPQATLRDTPPAEHPAPESNPGTQKNPEIERLTNELNSTREYLQSNIEKLEALNEELRSANEEIISSNEELQSTNEELESSQEELQSSNEELNTLNSELQLKNTQLDLFNNDLNNVLKGMSIPIIIVDTELRLQRFTPAAEHLINLIPSDIDRKITDFKPNLQISDLEALLLQVIETLEPVEREVQDLTGRWYSLRIRPYRTHDNKIDGAVIVIVDIDALKRSMLQIEEERRLVRAIVETVRQPLLILDSSLHVTMANVSYYTMFQTTGSETVSRSVFDLCGRWLDDPTVQKPLNELVTRGVPFKSLEMPCTFAGVGSQTILISAQPFHQRGTGPALIMVSFENLTERQKGMKDRLQLRSETEGRKAAESALHLREEFLSIASHELKTPLTSLRLQLQGALRKLRKSNAPDEILKDLTEVVQDADMQGDRIAGLVNRLLDVTRITANKLELDRAPMDLCAMVRDVIKRFSDELETRGYSIHLHLDPSVEGHWDRFRLEQVLTNLLSNAIKFGSAQPITVTVKREEGHAHLIVRDRGLGIPQEFLAKLFQPFEQVSGKRSGGLGLGLYITQQIVVAHGGTIRIESEIGKGSCFFIDLPVEPSAISLPSSPPASPKARSSP